LVEQGLLKGDGKTLDPQQEAEKIEWQSNVEEEAMKWERIEQIKQPGNFVWLNLSLCISNIIYCLSDVQ